MGVLADMRGLVALSRFLARNISHVLAVPLYRRKVITEES